MKPISVFVMIFFNFLAFAQDGFALENKEKTVIKFKLINNLIFIPININGVELTFMLDSGIAETILFSLENRDVDFKNIEKITFRGLGETVNVEALKSLKTTAVLAITILISRIPSLLFWMRILTFLRILAFP